MGKKGYYEFDPVIYPRFLWVHIGQDLPEVVKLGFDSELVYGDPRKYCGVTYCDVIRKGDRKIGMLMSFPKRKYMTMDTICHEAMHVVDDIEMACGIKHGGEPSAFLMGWVSACVNKARLGQGNFIEVSKTEKVKKGKIVSFSLTNNHKFIGVYQGTDEDGYIFLNPCIMRNSKQDGAYTLSVDDGKPSEMGFKGGYVRNFDYANDMEQKVYQEVMKEYDRKGKD